MIEFNGELTGKAKEYLIRNQIRIQMIASTVTAIIYSVPVVLTAFWWNILFILFIIPLILLVVVSLIPPSKKAKRSFMPLRIFIDPIEETVVSQCEKGERFRMLEAIEKIVDYGDFYHIIFSFGNRDPYFVCQKSLLTKGTIEEFEALFEGKIERRNKCS